VKLEPFWWQAVPREIGDPTPLLERADVAIVGSGLTGLVAALYLARGGRKVVVLEAGEIGIGASSRNAGYVGRTFKYTYGELLSMHGEAYATALYRELRVAFDEVRALIENEKIECGFVMQGRFIMAASSGQWDALRQEFDLRTKYLGDNYEPVARKDQARQIATDIYHGGVVIEDMAGLHPGLYHQGLLDRARQAGASVVAHTPVQAIRREGDKFKLATARGRVTARDVIVATNGYSGRSWPWLQRRALPFDAYMIATEPLPSSLLDAVLPGKRTFIDWNFNVDFVRRAPDDSRILFGGNTGVIGANLTVMAETLRGKLRRMLPQLGDVGLTHSWTGRCAATRDLYPHMGVEEGVHYALGYCFAGVPMGTHFGIKLARRILGQGDAQSVFWQRPFKAIPLYWGNPWFVPYAMRWYSRKDWR
jgi:glycine/D-amino acid oxidase-like deaminating enzyme